MSGDYWTLLQIATVAAWLLTFAQGKWHASGDEKPGLGGVDNL